MNSALKVTKIGNSAGVILPRDVLAHLNVQVGGTLSLVTTPRGIELSAAPDFKAQMAAAREVMLRRKRALRELAKQFRAALNLGHGSGGLSSTCRANGGAWRKRWHSRSGPA